ncbi:hypothetical protein VNO80_16450 [Phaseolus coccineus]|uniref:Uncharacterized protein n=1 Tax=Phaseolus coccineus TaxID=3886 RepID=A0AAN9R2R2_PHACN
MLTKINRMQTCVRSMAGENWEGGGKWRTLRVTNDHHYYFMKLQKNEPYISLGYACAVTHTVTLICFHLFISIMKSTNISRQLQF